MISRSEPLGSDVACAGSVLCGTSGPSRSAEHADVPSVIPRTNSNAAIRPTTGGLHESKLLLILSIGMAIGICFRPRIAVTKTKEVTDEASDCGGIVEDGLSYVSGRYDLRAHVARAPMSCRRWLIRPSNVRRLINPSRSTGQSGQSGRKAPPRVNTRR